MQPKSKARAYSYSLLLAGAAAPKSRQLPDTAGCSTGNCGRKEGGSADSTQLQWTSRYSRSKGRRCWLYLHAASYDTCLTDCTSERASRNYRHILYTNLKVYCVPSTVYVCLGLGRGWILSPYILAHRTTLDRPLSLPPHSHPHSEFGGSSHLSRNRPQSSSVTPTSQRPSRSRVERGGGGRAGSRLCH